VPERERRRPNLPYPTTQDRSEDLTVSLDVAGLLTALGPDGQLVALLIVGIPLVLLAAYLTSESRVAQAATIRLRRAPREER
jgi:hypothetical protein